jgi:hypothetical protein
MLSDKAKTRKNPKKRPTGNLIRGMPYSDNQKLDVVKMWLITGNMMQVSAALGIPYETVKTWRYSKWWDEVVQELRTENTIQLSQKLKKIADKALDVTLDRLEHGDFFYDQKTGEIVRKPVVMRDAYMVAVGNLDRHIDLDRKPQEEAAQQKTEDRLAQLAEAFAKFAGKAKKIEVLDAVYEEREAGLQEGAPLGKNQSEVSGWGSGEEGPSSESDGEEDWEQAQFDARGSQEGAPAGPGFKLSEQLAMDELVSEPSEGSTPETAGKVT